MVLDLNKFKILIGIELHIKLNTKTKLFSPAHNIQAKTGKENEHISVIDLAYPGTIPNSLNEKALLFAIKLALFLKMKLANKVSFDRKHYFYPDLPKGFQITQYFNPLATQGFIELQNSFGKIQNIKIKSLHLEEDTAKKLKVDQQFYTLDYNRAGAPLIELVTYPIFKNAAEVINFLSFLKNFCFEKDIVSEGFEKANFRSDINISLRNKHFDLQHTRTEIKNLNSFEKIKLAIDLEISKQMFNLSSQNFINQSQVMFTKFWDDKNNDLIVARTKSESKDYFYKKENNLPEYFIDRKIVKRIKKELNTDLSLKKKIASLKKFFSFTKEESKLFLQDKAYFLQFYKLLFSVSNQKEMNIIKKLWFNEIINKMKEKKKIFKLFFFKKINFLKIVFSLKENKINSLNIKKFVAFAFNLKKQKLLTLKKLTILIEKDFLLFKKKLTKNIYNFFKNKKISEVKYNSSLFRIVYLKEVINYLNKIFKNKIDPKFIYRVTSDFFSDYDERSKNKF